jgi:hypothetical protein
MPPTVTRSAIVLDKEDRFRHEMFAFLHAVTLISTCLPTLGTPKLRADERHRKTAVRVHGFFAEKCPDYRSLYKAIEIRTELLFEPLTSS